MQNYLTFGALINNKAYDYIELLVMVLCLGHDLLCTPDVSGYPSM